MEKNKLQHHNITTDTLFDDIRNIIEQGRRQAYAAANQITVLTYWHIGRRIVEEEQHGEARAQYGTRLIKTLAEQLMPKYGNTFSKRQSIIFPGILVELKAMPTNLYLITVLKLGESYFKIPLT